MTALQTASAQPWTAADSSPRPILTAIATLSAIVVACILLTHWPIYNYVVLGGKPPLVYYLLAGLFAFLLAFTQPLALLRLLKEPLLWWFFAYVISGLAWLLMSQGHGDYAGQQWRLRLWALFIFSTVLLISSLSQRRVVVAVIAATMLLAAALNWYDAMHPFTLVPRGIPASNPGRGAGLFINANGAAAFIIMATIVALPHVVMRWRGALLILAMVAVAPTFSRFGVVFTGLLVVLVIFARLLDRRQILIVAAAVPLLLGGAALYYEFILKSGNENVLGRLVWFESIGRLTDFSTRERQHVAEQAWEQFLENPLLGEGIGATVSRGQRAGTHNMYLLLMAEQGLIGLALYLALIGTLAYRGRRLMRFAVDRTDRDIGCAMVLYALFIALYGVVSHNVLEEPHGMFLLAFLAAAGFHATQRSRDAAGAWAPG